MGGPPDDHAREFGDLVERVRALELRLDALERERRTQSAPVSELPAQAAPGEIALPSLPSAPGGIIPVLGRALLGIAGAYLLRALAESGVAPQLAVVAVALVYAGWWLVSSTRVASGDRFTTAVYGLTAALVIAPMLWETTVRFQVLPPNVTAAALVVFVALGAALAWPRNLTIITWITTLAGVATALALIVATRAVVPFTASLLVIAVVIEYAACRDHWLSERWLVAFTVDFSVFLLTFLMTRPNGPPPGYAPAAAALVVAIQIALLSLYFGSTIYRTLIHGLDITYFEIVQNIAVFLISIGGALEITRRAAAANVAVSVFATIAGLACYLVAFTFLDRKDGRSRNLHTYAGFGVALLVAAVYLAFSGMAQIVVYCATGAVAMIIAMRFDRGSLRVHAAIYILAASAASGLFGFGYDRMIGAAANWGALGPQILVVIAASALCYVLAWNGVAPGSRAAGVALAAVLCWGLIAIAMSEVAPSDRAALATARTAILCVVSLLLAWAGRRWSRPELRWLLYPLMIFAAFKLVVEDFALGRPVTMSLSLVCYGGALILAPRLVRPVRQPMG